MQNILLQAREQESINYQSGDYEQILGEKITLNNGDQVGIQQSFIDTVESTSGLIKILEDTNLSITCFYYDVPYQTKNKKLFGTNADMVPTNDIYFLQEEQAGNVPGFEILETVRINLGPFPSGHFDGDLSLKYTDFYGNAHHVTYKIPKTKSDTSVSIPIGVIFNVAKDYSVNPQLKGVAPRVTHEKQSDTTLPVSEGGGILISNKITRVLKAGNYTPAQLVLVVNNLFVDIPNKIIFNTPVAQNSLLLNIRQLYQEQGKSSENFAFFSNNPPPANVGVNSYNISFSGSEDDNYFIGTSNFSLAFNDTNQTFEIQIIHQPIFDANGNLAIAFKPDNNATADVIDIFNKSSGIIISNLEPSDFWEEKLGFDILSFSPQVKTVPRTIDDATVFFQFIDNVQEKVNITGNFYSLDTLVTKNATAQVFQSLAFSTSDSFFTIPAEYRLNKSLTGTTDAYFMIEVDLGITTKLLGTKSYAKVQQIVSKYYNYQSYTVGSDGIIPYVHKGAPVNISSIRVRVLDPRGNVDENVGNDNTVFINVIKS